MRGWRLVACAVLGAVVSGCHKEALRTDLTRCEATRPQLCTQDYIPVCGYMPAGDRWKTFGNACSACADVQVEGWVAGPCPAP